MIWTNKGLTFGKAQSPFDAYYVLNVTAKENCCFIHSCCGKHIMSGDIVLLEPALAESGNVVLNAYKIKEGVKQCKFGFNTLNEMSKECMEHFSNKIAEVVEHTEDSIHIINTIKVIVIGKAIAEFQ